MPQVQTKTCTARGIMSSAAFVRGYTDVIKGKPFPDKIPEYITNDMWNYERGRLFGCVYKVDLKRNRSVTNEAVYAFYKAFQNGSLI